jgi:hypothetical protein
MEWPERSCGLTTLALAGSLLALLLFTVPADSSVSRAELPGSSAASSWRFLRDDLQSQVSTLVTSGIAEREASDVHQSTCPAGMVLLGGGLAASDVNSQTMPASGPTVAGYRLLVLPSGSYPAPTGWHGGTYNAAFSSKAYNMAAVCMPRSGAPLSTEVATSTASSSGSGGFGQTAVLCPFGEVAFSGGLDVADLDAMSLTGSGPTPNGAQLPHQLPAGTYDGPIGWAGSVRNTLASEPEFKVAAVCGPASGIKMVIVRGSVGAGSSLSLNAACAAGSIAIGGGVTADDLYDVQIRVNGPTFGSSFNSLQNQTTGTGPAPTGWEAQVSNDGASDWDVGLAVICARWPMDFFTGDEAPTPDHLSSAGRLRNTRASAPPGRPAGW